MNLDSIKVAGAGKRKLQRTILMDDETFAKLASAARYTGRSMSDIIRALVDELEIPELRPTDEIDIDN